MTRAEFFLPWPNRKLSPNARVHWGELHKIKSKAKNDAYASVLEARIGKIDAESLNVRYLFFPPDKRARDIDNLIASMKAANDGIALAIGVDDSKWHIEIAPFGEVRKGGEVRVQIEKLG